MNIQTVRFVKQEPDKYAIAAMGNSVGVVCMTYHHLKSTWVFFRTVSQYLHDDVIVKALAEAISTTFYFWKFKPCTYKYIYNTFA